jgi:hypothetical protein
LSNVCGTGDSYFFYLQQNGSFLYSVAPNPATDRKVRVTFADKAIAQELVKSLTLYSDKQEVVASLGSESLKAETTKMQSPELTLDASKAEPGTYYLHIDLGQEVFKERILLK